MMGLLARLGIGNKTKEDKLKYQLTKEDINLTLISDTDDINVRFIKRLHRQIRGTTKSRVQLAMIKLHLRHIGENNEN